MKIAAALLLSLLIGVLCRLGGIALPAPPVLLGAAVVFAMTLGYVLMDRLAGCREARHRKYCGGPVPRFKGDR